MSSSHQSTIMSLEQAKRNNRNMGTKYLSFFPISQIVSGKGSLHRRPCVILDAGYCSLCYRKHMFLYAGKGHMQLTFCHVVNV